MLRNLQNLTGVIKNAKGHIKRALLRLSHCYSSGGTPDDTHYAGRDAYATDINVSMLLQLTHPFNFSFNSIHQRLNSISTEIKFGVSCLKEFGQCFRST